MNHFTLSAFADEAGPDIESQIDALKRNGIPAIEIRNIDGICVVDLEREELQNISAMLASAEISVSAVASPIGKISVAEDFDAHLQRFRKAMDAAEILGTDKIRIFSFYIPKGCRPEPYQDAVLSRMERLVQEAEQRKMILCHENEKEIFGEQPEQVQWLFDKIRSKAFVSVFDPANYVQANVKPLDAYELTKNSIRYFHIKDCDRECGEIVPAGEGDGAIPEILRRALRDQITAEPICLTVEPHLAVFAGYENLGDDTSLKTARFHFKGNGEAFDYACNALKTMLNRFH